jgi:glycosyltransferase involved in cell wall biosynthesis
MPWPLASGEDITLLKLKCASSSKEEMPRVSVIIPTYNRAALLKKALQSILDQTFHSYEIIVVDDGSTDDTRDAVAAFASPKIRYLRQENKGRSHARNLALAEARGEYIAFLDSDDMFTRDKLEKQVALLDANPEYGMAYASARVLDDNDKEIFRPHRSKKGTPFYLATESGFIYEKIAFYLPVTVILPTVMVRNKVMKIVGGFDENLHRFEDTDMWRRISKITKIIAIPEPLCQIRTHAGNRMELPAKIFKSIEYYVEKIFRDDIDYDRSAQLNGACMLYLHYGCTVASYREYVRDAGKFFRKAFFYNKGITLKNLIFKRVGGIKWLLSFLFRGGL